MWKCKKCGRIFEKEGQMHSCNKIPLEEHFKNKDKAKDLFEFLVKKINSEIGKCKIISLPCCVHLFSNYDFLAILPKKENLEIRFKVGVFKIKSVEEIDDKFMDLIKESYFLKKIK
ncbi:MAG: hypothetical protein PHS06_04830 [Candidatus Shapirobacteria bacterium]|nr:hypothetical protein [Candidatus Shapirobacteria bacterium]